MKRFSFHEWTKEALPVEQTAQRALNEVLFAENEHQQRLQELGGEMSSNLTEEGQEPSSRCKRTSEKNSRRCMVLTSRR